MGVDLYGICKAKTKQIIFVLLMDEDPRRVFQSGNSIEMLDKINFIVDKNFYEKKSDDFQNSDANILVTEDFDLVMCGVEIFLLKNLWR